MKEENINKKDIVFKYMNYMEHHVHQVATGEASEFLEINQIAKELCISHQHLSDVVQQETGHHPCYFYDHKIIEEAQVMLINSKVSISEIAKLLTYDPSNFTKFFKKMTGMTPGQFREMNKN